jgi:hypothetical protein
MFINGIYYKTRKEFTAYLRKKGLKINEKDYVYKFNPSLKEGKQYYKNIEAVLAQTKPQLYEDAVSNIVIAREKFMRSKKTYKSRKLLYLRVEWQLRLLHMDYKSNNIFQFISDIF